jgi:hypothetical protein
MPNVSGRMKPVDASFRRCCGRLKNATDAGFCQLWWTWSAAPGRSETANMGCAIPSRPDSIERRLQNRPIDAASNQASAVSCRSLPYPADGPVHVSYATSAARSERAKSSVSGTRRGSAAVRLSPAGCQIRVAIKSPRNSAMSICIDAKYQRTPIHRIPDYRAHQIVRNPRNIRSSFAQSERS